MNNLAPMKNCPGGGVGVQGNLNLMLVIVPGILSQILLCLLLHYYDST